MNVYNDYSLFFSFRCTEKRKWYKLDFILSKPVADDERFSSNDCLQTSKFPGKCRFLRGELIKFITETYQ
jgi:hypothetical protein